MLSLSSPKKTLFANTEKRAKQKERIYFFIIIIYDAPFHSLIMLHYEHEEIFLSPLLIFYCKKSRRKYCKRYFMDIFKLAHFNEK